MWDSVQQRLILKITDYMLSGTLNSMHSLRHETTTDHYHTISKYSKPKRIQHTQLKLKHHCEMQKFTKTVILSTDLQKWHWCVAAEYTPLCKLIPYLEICSRLIWTAEPDSNTFTWLYELSTVVAVWLNGNALVLINVVALCRARLVLVRHLGI